MGRNVESQAAIPRGRQQTAHEIRLGQARGEEVLARRLVGHRAVAVARDRTRAPGSRTRSRVLVRSDTAAQSRTSPNENAVWSCSPTRMGRLSLGSHSSKRRRRLRLERRQSRRPARARPRRPSLAARPRAGGARPGRTGARTSCGPCRGCSATSPAMLAGVRLRARAARARRGERRARGTCGPGGPAASGRARPNASRSSRRTPA